MNNPMEFFRKGAEKRKTNAIKKSMYGDGDEVYGPQTESQATLEKMKMLNDMGLLGNQNFFPNAKPKDPFAPGSVIPRPKEHPHNSLTEKDLPAVDQYGRPLKGRSMVRQAMMKKLKGL